jgi:SAM-dependent methyltransferase
MSIYNNFAIEFDKTRYNVWSSVKGFLSKLEKDSIILELGSGNGKNMLYRSDLNFYGIDNSIEQVNICKNKNLNVIECNITNLIFNDNYFDNMICIATYHHLDNDIHRQKCLNEIYRCLKPNGQILLTVFAMEQPINSKFKFTKTDEIIPWNNKFLRYYHIYRKDELQEEILKLNNKFTIIDSGLELGNWWIILSK